MRPIFKLIKPDLTEIVLYTGLGLGLLMLNNIQRFWAYLSSGADFDNVIQYNDAALAIQQWLLDLELKIDPRFADFTAWMIIGAISITVVMVAQHVLGDSGEDVSRAKMLSKTRFGHITRQETTYRIALRAAGILLLIIWLRIFFGAAFNELSKIFFEASINILSAKVILIPLTVVLAGMGIYVFAICARLIALRVRVFS